MRRQAKKRSVEHVIGRARACLSVIVVAFQSVFYSEKHVNNVILWVKNYF